MDVVKEWLKRGSYLPPVLRDFHDQKDVFRTMHVFQGEPPEGETRPDWTIGQIYVIDCFLWFMARRGYTLQRSRAQLPFRDLEADVQLVREAEDKAYAESLGAAMKAAKGGES